MPSHIEAVRAVCRARVSFTTKIGARLCGFVALASILHAGCAGGKSRAGVSSGDLIVYPPSPQPPRVVALGNLHGGRRPSKTETELAVFFFGVEPEPSLGLVKPTGVAIAGGDLLVCDAALGAVFRWDGENGRLEEVPLADRPGKPIAVETCANDELLLVDAATHAVLRCDSNGSLLRRYRLEADAFRPAAAIRVDDQVWVSNAALHRLEVFDAPSGRHLRSIGTRGSGPGQFGFPLGLARTPEGRVCVADMLNARVQLFNSDGDWLRDVGGPGEYEGSLGWPKDVAVAPDGNVFVVDAATQRVHVFDAAGRPLMAFGQAANDDLALVLPHGIAIALRSPMAVPLLPRGFAPQYYILVSEQLHRPGVRVYAWGAVHAAGFDSRREQAAG